MGVSVVLAVKDEENNIKRCLDSVRWADEIIIVDNNSKDNTAKIAKRYTKKIYPYKKDDMIPVIQQYGVSKAKEEWILILDADVVVPEKAQKEIMRRIGNQEYNGYYLPHVMVAFGKKMRYALFCRILKLFRKGKGTFEISGTHCKVRVKGKVSNIKNPLLHYAHPDISTFVRKMNLYTTQDAEKVSKTGKGGLLNKKIKKVGIYNLLVEPFLYSCHLYLRKRYCKDGKYGLIITILMGFYLFLERAKTYEFNARKN